MRRVDFGWVAVSALCLAVVTATAIRAQDQAETEIPTGGLMLVANGTVQPEQVDVTIAPDRIRVVYVLRNVGDQPETRLVTFPLPDLDMTSIGDLPPLLARPADNNFVDAVVTVDGSPVVGRLEQRALALGLDVSAQLAKLGLSPFPYAPSNFDTIKALSDADKEELYQRGILRVSDDYYLPAWVLKSVLAWSQPFPTGSPVTLALTYVPIVGRPAATAKSLSSLAKSTCLSSDAARAIKEAASAGTPKRLVVASFQATLGAAWLDTIGKFRLTVEKPRAQTIIATCKSGLKASTPTQFEWTNRDHSVDDDIMVLFAD